MAAGLTRRDYRWRSFAEGLDMPYRTTAQLIGDKAAATTLAIRVAPAYASVGRARASIPLIAANYGA